MPAQMILPAVEQLKTLAGKTCEQHQLSVEQIRTFSTPRRLTVQLLGLPEKQADRTVELKGPPAAIAKDADNNWTKAAEGFARKNGVAVDSLEIREFDEKDYLFVQREELGKPVPELLQAEVEQWISQLNFPKNMRWGSYRMRFIRPVRWIVSLWNNQIVPVELEMVNAGNKTRGHRFLSSGKTLLNQAEEYEKELDKLHVMADFEKRRDSIISQVKKLEQKYGFEVELEERLLTEVTNLLEWPTVLMGDFEEHFLELPSEVLVTSMAVHQRYFPVFQKNTEQDSVTKILLPHFVTVRNGNENALDTVRRGNAKVLRARLSDARFFFLDDQQKELTDFQTKAEKVVFFQERGSQAQRVQRIAELSAQIAHFLELSEVQLDQVQRIAELSKFDLESQMVSEFPELQGLMGQIYAKLKKESALVCRGIREHYHPRNSKDSLPQDLETVAVALADKLDMLTTAFSLDMIPTGAADPYALRRTAQGIIQLIMGSALAFDFETLTSAAIRILVQQQQLKLDPEKLQTDLLDFLLLRLRWFLQERGIRYDLIEAVLQSQPADKNENAALPLEQLKFAEFLGEHLENAVFKRSVEAIVRAANISHKYPDKIVKIADTSALQLPEEKNFFAALKPMLASEEQDRWTPEAYLEQLHLIEPVVTKFFEDVMVMDENPLKCGNRLWMCSQLAKWSGRYLDLRALVFA